MWPFLFFIGELEAMEVLKIILERGIVLRNTMVYVDLDIEG